VGGYGSGRRCGAKGCIEDYQSIDINFLNRSGHLSATIPVEIAWRLGGTHTGGIWLRRRNDGVEFLYPRDEHDTEFLLVPLDWTACNFGGSRPWFLCPGCHRRVGRLVRVGTCRFYCRRCLNLRYYSQTRDWRGRQLWRAQRIAEPLGGEGVALPPRPKGMYGVGRTRLPSPRKFLGVEGPRFRTYLELLFAPTPPTEWSATK
jgi:hypothetical protein